MPALPHRQDDATEPGEKAPDLKHRQYPANGLRGADLRLRTIAMTIHAVKNFGENMYVLEPSGIGTMTEMMMITAVESQNARFASAGSRALSSSEEHTSCCSMDGSFESESEDFFSSTGTLRTCTSGRLTLSSSASPCSSLISSTVFQSQLRASSKSEETPLTRSRPSKVIVVRLN